MCVADCREPAAIIWAQAGAVPLRTAGGEVRVAGSLVQLTPTEYDLLRILVSHAGKVLTHHQLSRQVWGAGYEQEAHLLPVNISNLRRKPKFAPCAYGESCDGEDEHGYGTRGRSPDHSAAHPESARPPPKGQGNCTLLTASLALKIARDPIASNRG